MISGAMRGKGLGDALARHLLKPENDEVIVIAPRGLGSIDLVGQVRELVALSLGGRSDQPIYHVHCDPDPAIADNDGARARWWSLFEGEFGLRSQPYCGAVHVKYGRRHEHRVYSVVRPDGSVVDLAWDYARREKVSRVIEFGHGLEPVPSKHARAIARQLREDGRDEVADWLTVAGMLEIERPIAPLSAQERLIEERSGIKLSAVRAAALDAWRASDDGDSLRAALAERGLRLHAGRAGPVVIDRSGTAHLVTRLVGAASRADGTRIPAAAVRARLAGLSLTQAGGGDGSGAGQGSRQVASAYGAARPDRVGAPTNGAGGLGNGGAHRGASQSHRGGDGAVRGDLGAALHRLDALPRWRRGRLAGRLQAGFLSGFGPDVRARLAELDEAKRRLGNGLAIVDMHGIGQLQAPAP